MHKSKPLFILNTVFYTFIVQMLLCFLMDQQIKVETSIDAFFYLVTRELVIQQFTSPKGKDIWLRRLFSRWHTHFVEYKFK